MRLHYLVGDVSLRHSESQVPSTNHHILHISIVQTPQVTDSGKFFLKVFKVIMYGTMTGHKTMPQKFTKSVS